MFQSRWCHSSLNDGVLDAEAFRSITSGYDFLIGFLFFLIASVVGSELDFSHRFTALSVGNSSIFTHFFTFNSIRFVFPCPLSALFIGSGCCFLYDNAVATKQDWYGFSHIVASLFTSIG